MAAAAARSALVACGAVMLVLLQGVGAAGSQPFYADWMGHVLPAIANLTVLDLSLPGTHDSMTWDLSNTVADNANDLPATLAWVLHEFHGIVEDVKAGDFIRDQAHTQGLNMTEQLDAGIRFIDFRVIYTAGPTDPSTAAMDWYCLHMVQTNHLAMEHLTAAKEWLLAHPKEILVFWVSRHGDECGTTFQGIPVEVLQAFWAQVEQLFEGLLFDTRTESINSTTVAELIDRGHRMVMYVSDYHNVTNSSPLALDGCTIDNQTGDDIDSANVTYPQYQSLFKDAPQRIEKDKSESKFYLLSMAGGAPRAQMFYAALIFYLPEFASQNIAKCAAVFNIPGMDNWCPMHLQDVSQLTNYYNQLLLDDVVTQGWGLPNAIYLDAVDYNGTIRTGYELFGANLTIPTITGDGIHNSTGFGYVDTFALVNVIKGCKLYPSADCSSLLSELQGRRELFPVTTWNDPAYGRLESWPPK